jgi:hypothetical protein
MKTVNYASSGTPDDYVCSECSARGVRLYRGYSEFVVTLRCTACALKDQKKDVPDNASAHSIGWLVAAVPTENNETVWGYSSVPQPGVEWWNRLPVVATPTPQEKGGATE